MVQNDKKLRLSHSLFKEPYIMWLSFMVQMCKMLISPCVFFNFKILISRVFRELKGQKMAENDFFFFFSFFKILIFGVFRGVKEQKMTLNYQFQCCFILYLRSCRSYHRDFDNDINRVFSLFFLKKCNIVNIKIILIFIAPIQQFFK